MKVLSSMARAATALPMMTSNTTLEIKPVATANSLLLDDFMIPPFDPLKSQRRIFLLRHGETEWNARGRMQGGGFDIELNESGQRQAELLAQELVAIMDRNNNSIDVVASSHLQRAQQTAQVLHSTLSLEQRQLQDKRSSSSASSSSLAHKVISMPEFGEMRFGSLEGNALRGPESTEETRALFQQENAKMQLCMDYTYPGDGGESVRCVETRGKRGVETLYQQYPEAKSIAIVAHGRFNKVLLASLLYNDALLYPQVNQGNTCINVIDHAHDGTYEEVILSYMNHITREQ